MAHIEIFAYVDAMTAIQISEEDDNPDASPACL